MNESKHDVYIKFGIIQINELNMNEKAILSILCYWSMLNDKKECNSTYGILTKKFNLTKYQVRTAIANLIDRGYLYTTHNIKEKQKYISNTLYKPTNKAFDYYNGISISVKNHTTSVENHTIEVLESTLESVGNHTHKKEENEMKKELNINTNKYKKILDFYKENKYD